VVFGIIKLFKKNTKKLVKQKKEKLYVKSLQSYD
jgi:hypothetical protein